MDQPTYRIPVPIPHGDLNGQSSGSPTDFPGIKWEEVPVPESWIPRENP